jgi:hypothetical protein
MGVKKTKNFHAHPGSFNAQTVAGPIWPAALVNMQRRSSHATPHFAQNNG